MFLLHGVLEGTGLAANPFKSVLVVLGVFAILPQSILEGTGLVANPLESVLAVTGVLAILLQGVLEAQGVLTAGRALAAERIGGGVGSVEFGCHFQDRTFGMWCRLLMNGGGVVCICMYAKL